MVALPERFVSKQKTHRVVKEPRVSGRYLADYMAASETAQRSIIRGCKYPPIARVVQHDQAKTAISRYVWDGVDVGYLTEEEESLRNRLADSDFDRDLYDHNADYIAQFVKVHGAMSLPDGEYSAPGESPTVEVEGVRLSGNLQWRAKRTTKTNKIRVGAGTLRYSKGKALSEVVACWQSAFLFGYLGLIGDPEGAEIEQKLCITLDAYTGVCHPAPTNSVARFNQMKSACATIAERWENIAPPKNAVV